MSQRTGWLVGVAVLCLLTQSHGADISLWRFDSDGKTAGQPADTILDSIGTNNGTAAAAPVYSAVIPPKTPITNNATNPNVATHGGATNSLSLALARASSQYISVPDAARLRMGPDASFTVEAWVKPTTGATLTDASTRQWLVHKKSGAGDETTDYGVLVCGADLVNARTWHNVQSPTPHTFTGNEMVLVFGDGAGLQTAVSNLEVPADGKWHLVLVSYNGAKDEVVFMVDYNAELLSGVVPGNAAGAGNLVIGAHSTGTAGDQPFDGLIDEVRISGHSLQGSADTTGMPANLAGVMKWWWNIEGSLPDGAFNLQGDRPWRMRTDNTTRLPETNTDYWDVLPVSGDPGNDLLKIFGAGNGSPGYLFWDATALSGSTDYIAPNNRAPGSTVSIRFRIDQYYNQSSSDAYRIHKWFRLEQVLLGAPFKDRLHVAPAFYDAATKTGCALYYKEIKQNNSSFPPVGGRFGPDLLANPGWHVLHMAMYVDPADPTKVHHKYWIDGVLEKDYFETVETGSSGPTLPNNDNGNNQLCDTSLDYVRFCADAAFDPNGVLLAPGETGNALCSNGFDDDGDGLTDCQDSGCAPSLVCKCYPQTVWADKDNDTDVDMDDFALFQECFGRNPLPTDCFCFDRDNNAAGDGDVDVDDFKAFQACASGASVPAPACP